MRIGEVAERTGVTTKTIRYYESIGLLPEPDRLPSGYRDYGPATIEQLRFVRDAQDSGLSLAEIASLIELKRAGESTCEHTLELVHRHLRDLDDQIARLRDAREELAGLADRADTLDHRECTDPNRCHIISTQR